jgi:hypothetical protein
VVQVRVADEHWQVAFDADGRVEADVFRSTGRLVGEAALAQLFARAGDPAP